MDDPSDQKLRFAPIIQYEPFQTLVPLRDPLGNYYETGADRTPQGQSAVRDISEIAHHRILAAAPVAVTGISALPATTAAELTAQRTQSRLFRRCARRKRHCEQAVHRLLRRRVSRRRWFPARGSPAILADRLSNRRSRAQSHRSRGAKWFST